MSLQTENPVSVPIHSHPSAAANSTIVSARSRNRNRRPPSVNNAQDSQTPRSARPGPPRQTPSTVQNGIQQAPTIALTEPGSSSAPAKKSRPRRRPGKSAVADADQASSVSNNSTTDVSGSGPSQKLSRSRQQRFGARLTADNPSKSSLSTRSRAPPPPAVNLADLDLTSRLIHSFTHKEDGVDCPVCFESIHPAQPIWQCSYSGEATTCCWTTFHLKCIKAWARKSVTETREAYRARNEDRDGEWRCPGCQTKRNVVPQTYKCFCGRAQDPKGGRLATPHSCGERCIRPRNCEHPCSIPCHPGPCPPCVLSVERQCYCGQEQLVIRCSTLHSDPDMSLTCGRPCNKPLSCGKHACQRECHPGECGSCSVVETVRCYCGKSEREVACGEGTAIPIVDGHAQTVWEGRFECSLICEKPFACGVHSCTEPCHPHSLSPTTCPNDPSVILTCPCGKRLIETLPSGVRTTCTDPIPTCGSTCGKPHPSSCGHACLIPCHLGPCPPCQTSILISCRCGETSHYVKCGERREALERGEGEILCKSVCSAMRHCGRHACSRVCCPLAVVGKKTGGKKGKRRAVVDPNLLEEEDVEGWHTCDLTCNKRLTCGNHLCTQPDHRGPCPPCLQSSFDELICNCGRTVMMPPIPCGTKIECPYPCARPSPPCGHPKSPHSCHEDGECPPCPYLTSKVCACGKNTVGNIRCSQEKVSCGKPCGKLLECGFHHCDKLCHSGDCGSCSQVCAKPRKLCGHGCKHQCHAPSACPEDEPCTTVITLRCACGRLQQPATCGACDANPVSRGSGTHQLKCAQECIIAKRNRNLAEALGININDKTNGTGKFAVTYSDDILGFARANAAFISLAERTLNDFVSSDRKLQILPHMPPAKREFMRKLCEIYRINTQEVDQEPKRSVQLTKRIDTRIPEPLLSKAMAMSSTSTSQGPSGSATPLGTMKKASWGPSPRVSTAPTPTPTPPVSTPPPKASAPTSMGGPLTTRFPNSMLNRASAAPSGSGLVAPTPIVNIEEDVPSRWDADEE